MKRILSPRSFLFGLIAFCCIILLLLFPQTSAAAAAEAAEAWLRSILPVLLPFSVLCSIFIKSGTAQRFSRYLSPVSRFFGFSDCFAYVFFMSLLSGYPIGTKLTAELCAENQISREEASVMINAASTSGPGFLVSTLAVGLLGSHKYILPILLPHILSSVITAYCSGHRPHPLSRSSDKHIQPKNIGSIFLESMTESSQAMLIILGAMVLFSALSSSLLQISAFLCSTPFFRALICGAMEFSTGCIRAAELPLSSALPLISFICGFGGCSVFLQTYAFASAYSIPIKGFLKSKFLQGCLAAFLSSIFAVKENFYPLLISAAFVLLSTAVYFLKKPNFKHKKAIRCK